ncbi:MAG: fibronectin type III domain-containing protein [Nitriliruptorales bacterium]
MRQEARRRLLAGVLVCALGLILSAGISANGAVAATASIQSDEFNTSQLDTNVWTFVDPVGDASLSLSGTQAVISVPAGVGHDLWSNANHAPRLLQSITNGDFEVEVKFDSQVLEQYELQGIVVEQDADDLLRLEVHHDGSGTRLFVAALEAGAASTKHYSTVPGGEPVYLRVKRLGDSWTLRYSNDGVDWTTSATFTHALVANEIGPFAGNAGVFPPAFAALIDHFRVIAEEPPPPSEDTTAPVISGVSVSPSGRSATVSWQTDEAADSRVEYGTTSALGSSTVETTLVTSHAVSITGLSCATTYHFRVGSWDAAGNEATGEAATFTTAVCATELSSDEFDAAALDTGRWRLYDPRGDAAVSVNGSQLVFGVPGGVAHDLWTGALHAPRLLQVAPDADFEIEAKFDVAVTQGYQLQGLVVQQDDDDLIRFDVYSDGSETRLFAASFTAGTADVRAHTALAAGAPVFLRLRREGTTWTARYSPDGVDWTTVAAFAHSLTVTEAGLFVGNAGGTPPAFEAKIDHFRVIAEEPPPPSEDTTAPVITDVAATPDTDSAVINWTTDEPATSRVDYGPTESYGSSGSSNEFVTSHGLTITGLSCETLYHFRVVARDGAGNEAVSADRTFVTGTCPPPDVTPPVISSVLAEASTTSAYVSWTTDEPATSNVDFGLDAMYGGTVASDELVTAHTLTIANLACATTYHFRVRSADSAGNVAESDDGVFTTGACPAPGAPVIDVWYGDNQVFGNVGLPQQWANVVGHASDPDKIAGMSYSLNGAPSVSLVINPDVNPRIARFGDFNVEIPFAALVPGDNRLEVVARDTPGNEATHVVTITYVAGNSWPLPYTADWASASQISSVAQVVDGRWHLADAGVRPTEPGYDRLIALGQMSWLDYEVTVPITIHSLNDTSSHAGVGIAIGWQGHEGSERPRTEWPLGGLCFYYRNAPPDPYELWMVKYPWPHFIASEGRPNWLDMGVTYMWKFRAESLVTSPGNARYSCKVWQADEAEPSSWNVTADMPARPGSVLLVADYADATFGNVSVRPLAP